LVGEVAAELGRLGMGRGALALGFTCEDDPAGLDLSCPDYELIAAGGDGPGVAVDGSPAESARVRTAQNAAEPSEGSISGSSGESAARAFSEQGVDRVEFLASFNAGETRRPLGQVASGGETSRFLLALATVFGARGGDATVILDEVDEGIGGRSGALVGAALARLAAGRQVLCITHLPQVAAFGDRHLVVRKLGSGGRTWTEVEEVTGEERLGELAAMLGGDSEASRAAARELLRAAGRP
jgi:DNA repair protein RecN (Recombination protein N)